MRHYRNKDLGWSSLIENRQTIRRVVDEQHVATRLALARRQGTA
jgi:hypothetical protein